MRDLVQKQSEVQFAKPEKRPATLAGITAKILTGCGNMYIVVNKDSNGNIFEVIAYIGKKGVCAASQAEAISELASLSLQCKVSPKDIIGRLKGISCSEVINNDKAFSCANAIGITLEKVINEEI